MFFLPTGDLEIISLSFFSFDLHPVSVSGIVVLSELWVRCGFDVGCGEMAAALGADDQQALRQCLLIHFGLLLLSLMLLMI